MLCGVIVVGTEHWQFVSAASLVAVVSDGAKLVDEHGSATTQCSCLSVLSVCFHWLVIMIANHSFGCRS